MMKASHKLPPARAPNIWSTAMMLAFAMLFALRCEIYATIHGRFIDLPGSDRFPPANDPSPLRFWRIPG
jgi:hypothetical protein